MRASTCFDFLYGPCGCVIAFILTGCAQVQGLTGGAGTLAKASSVEDRCNVIVKWASRFEEEYPDWFVADVPRSQHRRIDIGSATDDHQQRFANLYRDEWFIPVFGKAYDQLSPKEKNSISVPSLLPCNDPKKYQNAARFQRYEILTRPLVGGAVKVKDAVVQARTLQKEMTKTLVVVRGYAASQENYRRVEEQIEQWGEKIDHFWPSERDAFLQALETESRRQLLVALPAMITEGVNASDYEGVLALHHFPKEHPGIFDEVPSDIAIRERQRMKDGVTAGLTKLLRTELKRLDARGSGLSSLKAEGAWYADIDARYMRIFGVHPSINSALEEFTRLREPDVSTNAEAVATLLRQAKTVAQIDAVTKDYVIPPIDAKSAAGKPLVTIIEDRRPWMKFDEDERWKFAAHEVSLMNKPGVVEVPKNYVAPDSEEIRLAVMRAFEREGGEFITAHVVKWRLSSVDRMFDSIGMRAPVPYPQVLVPIATVRLKQVDNAHCQPEPGGGYRCEYELPFKLEMQGITIPVLEPWFGSDRFMLTSSGWESRSASDKIARKSIEVLGALAKGIMGGR